MKQIVTHTDTSFALQTGQVLNRVLPARPVLAFDGERLIDCAWVCTENGRQVYFKCPKDAMTYFKNK